MRAENFTRLSIDVPERLHKVMKMYVISNHLNIKNYVLNLIKNDLSEEMEDYLLGQMALESVKEGFIGPEKSGQLLKKLLKGSKKKKSPNTQIRKSFRALREVKIILTNPNNASKTSPTLLSSINKYPNTVTPSS